MIEDNTNEKLTPEAQKKFYNELMPEKKSLEELIKRQLINHANLVFFKLRDATILNNLEANWVNIKYDNGKMSKIIIDVSDNGK